MESGYSGTSRAPASSVVTHVPGRVLGKHKGFRPLLHARVGLQVKAQGILSWRGVGAWRPGTPKAQEEGPAVLSPESGQPHQEPHSPFVVPDPPLLPTPNHCGYSVPTPTTESTPPLPAHQVGATSAVVCTAGPPPQPGVGGDGLSDPLTLLQALLEKHSSNTHQTRSLSTSKP